MTLTINEDVSGWNLTTPVFLRWALENELRMMRQAHWQTDVRTVDTPPTGLTLMQAHYDGDSQRILWRMTDRRSQVYAHTHTHDGEISVVAAGTRQEGIHDMLGLLRDIFPEAERGEDDSAIPLYLWTMTAHGPRRIRREIEVPRWEEIKTNYPASVRTELATLMENRPAHGKILLFSGPPGCGKTYALRALGHSWRSWCTLHYVVDPEIMFGEQAAYLVNVLLDSEEGPEYMGSTGEKLPQWRLLVLEDTGELITADAKEHVGQALSRLFNVTDGLIGQGIRVMILITTNEEPGKLHGAITRPGRCAARLEFGPFSRPEAQVWLASHGSDRSVTGEPTLAELYALLSGEVIHPELRKVGFQPRRAS